ncbi:hypothetical protein PCASD_25832 [Puccinia coronata f. sp. avenae]|uniref:Uncharacterized protein n=1 Tax=Puccinia coronata f. sp. avenae TaxID=200324 RepID=A0A2N5TKE6_9BASI|nr:hypothetical protein PCASD_25832 [Puccinia coronata f. sp. avenae]
MLRVNATTLLESLWEGFGQEEQHSRQLDVILVQTLDTIYDFLPSLRKPILGESFNNLLDLAESQNTP